MAPYLALVREDASQRGHSLREVFNALRYVVRNGIPWRAMPHALLPWAAVYQQAQRWLAAGCFERLAHDQGVLPRLSAEREPEPTAAVLGSRAQRLMPESGQRAGYDGAKRKNGLEGALGRRCARPPPGPARRTATADDRTEVGRLADAVQAATGQSIEVGFVDQGYTGHKPARAASEHGIRLEVVS